ncbi:hypothetical protein AYO45_02205 [Gammaproteobacteria bacterium SCGC AG-212-F23]|nr:hypothetical protein AYO45_02205 [Gammaproteobacteria bacterium SCGC AG-212-F23]
MKKLILILLSLITMNAFAESPQHIMQCPPASALHHYTGGQPWTLSISYQSQGWFAIQSPDTNWSHLNSLPENTNLVAYIDEAPDVGYFPYFVSCSYQYGSNSYESVILKSAYPIVEGSANAFHADAKKYDVYTCQTTGNKPEACQWKIRDVSVEPN